MRRPGIPPLSPWVDEEKRGACGLCPRSCSLGPGVAGACGVREGKDSGIALPYYGGVSSIAIDPIEKKPLFHFRPGSRVFSIGFGGCNLRCPWCQNFGISRVPDPGLRYLEPAELACMAVESGVGAVAYTYSEPLVHAEYVMACAKAVSALGLANVLVTNGYAKEAPASALLDLMDAVNVDLKTYDPSIYRNTIGGDLEEVKRFISQARERTWTEVTMLIVPGVSDDEGSFAEAVEFLASISPRMPLHLSRYFPRYKYREPPTDIGLLDRLAAIARASLSYVYLGNAGTEGGSTFCPECGALLVERLGYECAIRGLDKGRCASCGARADFIFR